MAHLQYASYPGFGERSVRDVHYSQAVRIGNRIEISGQGGWDPETEVISPDVPTQVDQAFSNCALALTHAGGKGWSEVYKIRMYIVKRNEEYLGVLTPLLRKYCPDHCPLITVIEVAGLALEGMRVEIEVEADLSQ